MMEFEHFPHKKGSLPTLAKEEQKKILMYVCICLCPSVCLGKRQREGNTGISLYVYLYPPGPASARTGQESGRHALSYWKYLGPTNPDCL